MTNEKIILDKLKEKNIAEILKEVELKSDFLKEALEDEEVKKAIIKVIFKKKLSKNHGLLIKLFNKFKEQNV